MNKFTNLGKNLNKKIFPREVNMDIGQMKNIVVLKNLPSNIVDEAIVVLKQNKKVKNIQYSRKNGEREGIEKNDNKYIVKEAELLINKYIKDVEEKSNIKKVTNLEKKYNIQKYISFGLAFVALVEFIIM